MAFRRRFVNWLLSENVYSALMVYPALLLVPTMLFLMLLEVLSFIIMIFIVVGYIVYMVALKYLKIIYQEKYKVYLYIFAIVYDVDYRKPSTGWIVIDSTETYPIEIGTKDQIILERKMIKEELNTLYAKKRNLTNLMISPIQMIKERMKEDKLSSEEKKKRKELEKFSKEREDELKKAIGKLDERIKALNEQLNKVAQKEKQQEELNDIKDSQKALLNSIPKAKGYGDGIHAIDLDKESYDLNKFTFFRARIVNSELYYQNNEMILLLPTDSIYNTFIFTDDYASFSNMPLEVPNYAVATFLEAGIFKELPYLICTYSSFYVKMGGLIQMKKEIAEALLRDAKLSYFADEVSQIKHEYETLVYDNMDLEKHNSMLSDQLKKQSKRAKELSEMKHELSRFSWKQPKKEYQMITMFFVITTIALTVLIFMILLFPSLFGLSRVATTVQEPTNSTSNSLFIPFLKHILKPGGF